MAEIANSLENPSQQTPEVQSISIDDIEIGENTRQLDDKSVENLAESIRNTGLMNPITTTRDGELVAGRHRLEAYRRLGMTEIPCIVIDWNQEEVELAQIDENLIRNELTVLERCEHLKRRKELYQKINPESKRGGDRRSPDAKSQESTAFAEEISQKTGRGRSTIDEEVAIAINLSESARDILRSTPAAKKKGILSKLSKIGDPAQQEEIAQMFADGKNKEANEALQNPANKDAEEEYTLVFGVINGTDDPELEDKKGSYKDLMKDLSNRKKGGLVIAAIGKSCELTDDVIEKAMSFADEQFSDKLIEISQSEAGGEVE